MASSSSSSSAPAFSSQSWNYDVFLSFRGEDTRCTFVDHLYTALERQGINTYKDDITLPRGESIGPSLIKAIGESQIALILFSKNYADSSWCLDELTHIMKCRDTRGQTVMPIFYDVDPSEVRKQKGKYGEAFSKHELENKAKVDSWRKALVDASSISGWEPRNIANGHEAEGIKQIVAEILRKLQPSTSSVDENLIGMAARLQGLKSELEIGSCGVRMIGIWGVGGGGKTTLASSIYDEICRQFDGCCFVPNIREESSRHGLGKLEEDILSKLGVNIVGRGRCMIKDRLCHRKVLIVLDDVDRLDQLKALAGSHDWFGEGSRIIITTRDKHILTAHKVNVIVNISLLNPDEAIKLFCKHAPRGNRPIKDYTQLSKEVVSYAGGLPLALTVLGSFLCDKDINEWKSALVRLKEIPDTDILEKLKISFDGLKQVEKDLFLDIACFLRWEYMIKTMNILDECGLHPVIGVKVLIQKALITITDYGQFDMHDLVQEMGHHIVRGEHPNNPEKHTRVWKHEDVLKICAMDPIMEHDMIEVIRVGNHQNSAPLIVANMMNLRWIEYNGEFMPSNFPQRKLCCLILSYSLQKQLWEGYKLLPNLKTIKLTRLDNLIMTPDFDGLPNLERFILKKCDCLEEVHPSIGRLKRLLFLSIEGCSSLKLFPPTTGLQKLETLSFFRCPELFQLSEIQQVIQQNIDRLPQLPLDDSGDKVASYKRSFTNFLVTWLTSCCSNLPVVEEPPSPHNNMKPCLRDNNMNHIGLQFYVKNLRKLDIGWCHLGDEEIGSAVWELPNLKTLHLAHNEFSRLSFSRLRLPQLKWLDVSWCKDLVELSELPSSIAVVIADHCDSLESFGDISKCKWLWKASLWGKNKLRGDILLHSMLQGNAIEDYFIDILLKHQLPKAFVGRMFKGRTLTLRLPDGWYSDFCGFLICIDAQGDDPYINIALKQEVDKEDSQFEVWQESKEALEPEYVVQDTCVGYVPFCLLKNNTFSSSSYTMISVKIQDVGSNSDEDEDLDEYEYQNYVGIELVRRKSKGDEVQTTKIATDSSEFWDDELHYSSVPFTIQHDSKSSINIVWQPYSNMQPL